MKDKIPMTSSKPFFFRAIYDWIEENELTTHVIVDAMVEGVDVPLAYVTDGEVILNISSRSVKMFENSNEAISFEARFNGKVTAIYVPIKAIKAVFARENQQGIFFDGGLVGEQATKELPIAKEKPKLSVSGSASEEKKPNSEKDGQDKEAKKSKRSKADKKGASHLKIIK